MTIGLYMSALIIARMPLALMTHNFLERGLRVSTSRPDSIKEEKLFASTATGDVSMANSPRK